MPQLTSNQTALVLLLVLLGAWFSLCCFGVAPLMDTFGPSELGAMLVFFCFGAIGGAASTIAILGVLPSWPFWFRMQLSFLLGTMLFGIWTIGLATSMVVGDHDASRVWPDWTVAVFCFPLIFLAVQAPLWLTRAIGNWTITRGEDNPDRRPLTIRDVLTGMALIGFAMAGAQLARQMNASAFSSESEFWTVVVGTAAVCMVVSLMAVLPIVLATLRLSKPFFGMILLFVYGSAALTVLFVTAGIVDGRFPRGVEMFGAFIMVSSFIVASSAPLLIARQLGCRLKWGRQPAKQAALATAETTPGSIS